jgi:predicted kinase
MKNILNIEITRPNQVLIVMRGIPGSGKSTLAKSLVDNGIIHSTDNVIESKGSYREFFQKMFETKNFTKLNRVHTENYKNVIQSIKDNISPVILDNTNIKINDAKIYVKTALEMGLDDKNIRIVDIGPNGLTAEELASRNTHGVPVETIKKMIASHKGQGIMTVEKILLSKDMFKQSNIAYSCVGIDFQSKDTILEAVGDMIPDGWIIHTHHMTIKMGELKDKTDLGKKIDLRVFKVGISDMAIAVLVSGYESKNERPHITVAVNPNGGKPVMSNDITKWLDIKPFIVKGKVTEILRNEVTIKKV